MENGPVGFVPTIYIIYLFTPSHIYKFQVQCHSSLVRSYKELDFGVITGIEEPYDRST